MGQRILFLSSEVAPFSKTGGLGDVSKSLPEALGARGHQVRVVTPLYRSVSHQSLTLMGAPLTLQFPFGAVEVRQYRAEAAVELYFIDAPAFFERSALYGYPDDARRFAVFSMAALAFAQRDGFEAQVVQCNDWPTGLALLALRSGFAHTPLGRARRVFSIHNLAYQGLFPKTELPSLGMPWDLFTVDGVEFFDQLSFMKAGLNAAELITTVSPSYAREIQTPAFGCGLDGLLRHRSAALHGVINGVDTDEWNPATDVFLPQTFTAHDLSGRQRCRSELLASCRLETPPPGMPVLGMVGRMVSQKGADLMQAVLPRWLEQGVTAVILGEGDAQLEAAWLALAAKYPQRLAVRVGFEQSLAHRIEAGVDFFVMPSRFEPCGLNQMYSQLYGAVPIVHAVGGLRDTVTDVAESQGTGIAFTAPTVDALNGAVLRAIDLYRRPESYRAVQGRGMRRDFSWDQSAREYERLFTL